MNNKKIILAFDMDDTLVRTGRYLHDFTYNWFADLKRHDYLEELKRLRESNVSTMSYPPHLKEVIDTQCVCNGLYMLHGAPSELCWPRAISTLREFLSEFGGVIEPLVCTHRGFHENGEQFTRSWLDSWNISDIFSNVHCIDSREHKDKIAYLKSQYPDCEIVIVDDNPLGKHDQTHEYQKEILIYDKENPLAGYSEMKKVHSMNCVVEHVLELVYQVKGWDA